VFHFLVQMLFSQNQLAAHRHAREIREMVDEVGEESVVSVVKEMEEFFKLMNRERTQKNTAKAIGLFLRYMESRKSLLRFPKRETLLEAADCLREIVGSLADGTTTNMRELLGVLVGDLFLFCAVEKSEGATAMSALRPASMILKSHAVVSMAEIRGYAAMFVKVMEALLIFGSPAQLDWEPVLISCASLHEVVASGPAGRDAFLIVFVHFMELEVQRGAIEQFMKFASSRSFWHARSFAAASIVFALDGECLPSHARLVQTHYARIVQLLADIMASFGPSPFVKKVSQVRLLYTGHDANESSLQKAMRIARLIWREGKVCEEPMPVLRELADQIYHPRAFMAFVQLGVAIYSNIPIDRLAYGTLFEMGAVIFPIANHISSGGIVELWRDLFTSALVRTIDVLTLILGLSAALTPREVVGAAFALSVSGFAGQIWQRSPDTIPALIKQLALSELVAIEFLVCDLVQTAQSRASFRLFMNLLCDSADYGWRFFMRLAAPILQIPGFGEYVVERHETARLVDAAITSIAGLDETELGRSNSLVCLWHTLGKWEEVQKLADLVALSIPRSLGAGEERDEFYLALSECLSIQGHGVLGGVIGQIPPGRFRRRSDARPSFRVSWANEKWMPEVTGFLYGQMTDDSISR
jgi:hypothetical protein